MKKILKSKLLILISFLIILGVIGGIWQSVMVSYEDQKYKSVGEFVNVGTYNAHYYSKGDGDTAFIFIAGAGTPCAYTDFYFLQNYLSSFGQTITFDHSGLGWSSKTDSPRNMENLVNELSIIIETVSIDNVVLICHSLGSLEAIGYTQSNPNKVKGIIFLDGGSPEFYSADSEFSSKAINRTLAFNRSLGINRFLENCGVIFPIYGKNVRYKNLPDDLRTIEKAMYNRCSGSFSNYKNIGYINENAETVLSRNRLGKIPILILSSDSGNEWEQVQIQLSAWSENSLQFTIENAKHYLYWSNCDETLEYIDTFIQDNNLY